MAKAKAKKLTPRVIQNILDRLSDGQSLRAACAKSSVTHGAFLAICATDSDLADRYARARDAGLELHADRLIELAETPMLGVETTTKANGDVETKEGDMLGHRKLQIDTIKWLLSRRLPKKYGDRVTQEHTGADGAPLTPPSINVNFVSPGGGER